MVTTNDYMSSEERQANCASTEVNQMFDRIDTYCVGHKSPQARRQMKERIVGYDSSRPQPIDAGYSTKCLRTHHCNNS